MLSSRLFWKLFLVCAGLNVAATFVVGAMVAERREQAIWRETQEQLRHDAAISLDELAARFTAGDQSKLQTYVVNLGDSTKLTFEVSDLAGETLARSSPTTEDHFTISDDGRLSHSQPLRDRGRIVGVLRVAADESRIRSQVQSARQTVWIVTVPVAVLIAGAGFAVVAQVVRPLATLQEAADAIAVGDYRQRVYVPHRDEIGALARSFNRMSQELDARMSQLRQSGQRQATVLGGMVEGVIAVDDRQRILFANTAAGKLFDFAPPAVEGRPLLEVVRVNALHEAVSAALNQRRPQRLEAEFDAADKLTVAIHATPLPGQPCPGAVLVLHDMTELRRLERVRQEFVANVSHELKTPLSSIKAYAETLRNGALNDVETSRRFTAQIEEQADRLHALILDMLTLARIESEQQVFDIVPVRVEEVVTACLEAYHTPAGAKQLQLTADVPDPKLEVMADREGLREILDNLVDNAIKYTPENGRVTVRCRAAENTALIEVEDTGIGIGDDHVARVFERFYRVDKARSREMGGTGLGLSIVKHLTQSLGGSVRVRSQKGVGSTFIVSLPIA